jgi:DNA polymerase-3 subunit gamma/tau
MCNKINNHTSMNVIEIDAASNNGVGNIRDIIEEVQYSPTEGRFKVYIIDEVHMLSTGAFNALLKTLEEPPEYVIFILATTEAHKIPITILSRCQRYDFKRISIDTIQARMQELVDREQADVEEKALRYIARMADGSLRDGLSLLDQCIAFYFNQTLTYDRALEVLGAVDTAVYSRMFRCLAAYDAVGCLELVDEMMVAGRDLTQFVNEMVWYLRNILLVGSSEQGSELVDVSTEQFALLQEESKLMTADTLIRYIRILSELSNQLRYAVQKRVMVEVALIKLCKPQMDRQQDFTTLLQRLEVVEKQLEQGVVQTSSQPAQTERNVPQEEKPQAPHIVPKAVPEDVREVLKNWNRIFAQCSMADQSALKDAKRTLGANGELVLQFTDPTAAGMFEQDSGRRVEELKTIIRNAIDKEVEILVRVVSEQENNQYEDIGNVIHFEGIEIV